MIYRKDHMINISLSLKTVHIRLELSRDIPGLDITLQVSRVILGNSLIDFVVTEFVTEFDIMRKKKKRTLSKEENKNLN